MTREVSIKKQLVLGLLFGAILLMPTRVEAQFHDAPAFAQRAAEFLKQAERWAKQLEHYTKMYDKAVQQVERLSNITRTLDEQLSRNKDLVKTIASIGKTVRGVFLLKQQLENMIRCRIGSIESLYWRLRSGIFDMQANKRDLEEYLKTAIGRASENEVSRLERLTMLDPEFERMRYELNQAYVRLAKAQELLKQYQDMLHEELHKADGDQQAIDSIKFQIVQIQQWIEQLNKQISELMQQITERAKMYGLVLDKRINFGNEIVDANAAYSVIVSGKEEILKEIDGEFEGDEGSIDEDGFYDDIEP